METLAIAIRQNQGIRGICVENEETKILQYADDTTAMLSDISSADISGLKINCKKTEGMWIGSIKENKAKPLRIRLPNEPIKTIGVYYVYDVKLLREKNLIERVYSIQKLINIWSSRGLSIYGKFTIIKSFLVPKFVYICALLPTSNELLKQLNQLLFKFSWKGTDKVRRVSVINEYEKGSLKMIDLEIMVRSLRLVWLKRIFNGNDGTWKRYSKNQLKPVGGLFFISCNYDVNEYTISSQFYCEVLLWWSQFRATFASESNWQRIIWNNKEIRTDKKTGMFQKLL